MVGKVGQRVGGFVVAAVPAAALAAVAVDLGSMGSTGSVGSDMFALCCTGRAAAVVVAPASVWTGRLGEALPVTTVSGVSTGRMAV